MKDRMYVALVIDPTEELSSLCSFVEKDGFIGYNGKIPHKILHLTIEPPQEQTLEEAKQKIFNLKNGYKIPTEATIGKAYTYPKTSKIMLEVKLNKSFEPIKYHHMTFCEGKSDYEVKKYLIKQKEKFESLIGRKAKIKSVAVIRKNCGIEYEEKVE